MKTTLSTATTKTDRRSFLKTLGLMTAVSAAPFAVHASNKSGTRNPVIGTGDHLYEVIHDWAQLPAGHAWGNTHSVAEDASGHIHIKHTVGKGAQCQDAIVEFDAEGRFVRSWGREFKGGAHGLQLSVENGVEYLYLADPARHRVTKTTLKGEKIWTMGPESCGDVYSNPNRFCPTNVAIGVEGDVYVADGYGESYIHRLDKAGNYRSTFGGAGKNPGQLLCPHGLMIDTRLPQPQLVVADRGNRRLQYFTLEGEHLGFVTEELRAPCHFAQRNGVLLVPDLESRVSLFDRENRLITHLGDGGHYNGIRDKAREAFTPGKFVAPHGACFDHAGNIFVVEWVEVGRVTKLNRI